MKSLILWAYWRLRGNRRKAGAYLAGRTRRRTMAARAALTRLAESDSHPALAARPSPPDDAVLRVDAKRWQAFCGMLDANEVQAVFLQMHFRHGGGQEQILYSSRLTEVVDAALASSTKKETPRG